MCLILFAHHVHPEYPLVVLANRDEFYHRPAAPANWWEETPELLAGKDLAGGGTWLGISKHKRFAALTNFREVQHVLPDAPTRGTLVSDFLVNGQDPKSYLADLHERGQVYNGFNLLLAEGEDLYHYSNRGDEPKLLSPGIYGLSNALLNTPWPKVEQGKRSLEGLLKQDKIDIDQAFKVLVNSDVAPDEKLPATGVPLEWERLLSAMYIEMPSYGTRCSTVVLIDRQGEATFVERSYVPAKEKHGYNFKW